MKDTRIENLINAVDEYYECDIKQKKRDASHVEARGLFIVLARREFSMPCSAISKVLGMSKSNIVRNHSLFLNYIKSDKHIRRRFEDISKIIKKVL